jgi:hypothetical protein
MMVFAIVWRMTPEVAQGILQLRSYAASVPEKTPPPETKKPEKAVKAKNPAKKPTRTIRAEVASAQRTIETPVYAERIAPAPQAAIPQPAPNPFGPSDFKVATESAELYSSNSPNGNVVRKLKKGDLVELQFKVNNAGPEWMFVNVANPRGSGFVRSDMVSKATN